MVAWVRKTGNKIVVCPEMTYQVDILDELLINPLPDDVKPFVVNTAIGFLMKPLLCMPKPIVY